MHRLEAVLGDIIASKLEVVVNAANTNLAAGGGVCGATKIAIATCIAAPDAITEIRFICFNESTLSIYEKVLTAL